MSDLGGKKPKVQGDRIAGLRLSAEERFVIARIDGQLTVEDLVAVTGIEPARLETVLSKLASDGAVDLDAGDTTSMADLAAALGMDPGAFRDEPARSAKKRSSRPPKKEEEPAKEPEPEEQEQEQEQEQEEEGNEEERALAERNYRQVYEARWHPLGIDQRVAAAKTVHGPDLLALAFDQDPRVIAALLENATVGLDHVRLIAFYHRTGTGLEMIARRHEWLRDFVVERRLMRNPMIGEIVLGRVMNPKPLFQTYKVAIDRDIPELTRVKCRGMIRPKWQKSAPEERADLLLRTEARCLTLMTGCNFDAKTTAILCGRPINSAVFVQSVAKFAASPPGLLAHLIKQPFVRKNMALKKMLLVHPNLPGDVKRNL
jgi:hypothetical protein